MFDRSSFRSQVRERVNLQPSLAGRSGSPCTRHQQWIPARLDDVVGLEVSFPSFQITSEYGVQQPQGAPYRCIPRFGRLRFVRSRVLQGSRWSVQGSCWSNASALRRGEWQHASLPTLTIQLVPNPRLQRPPAFLLCLYEWASGVGALSRRKILGAVRTFRRSVVAPRRQLWPITVDDRLV